MNLENWIRKDGDFLGFAVPGTSTSLPLWMIVSSTTELRDFADNDMLYDKIWDDREAYFVEPTTAPTFEYSGVTNSSFEARWSYVSGMTKYYVEITDEKGRIIQ